ncbi:MAG: hypothetical protein JWQ38_1960 [Flavipsychrobacter sp.]|nr:hypothetical protein [Flavipsychrobacter sp.]
MSEQLTFYKLFTEKQYNIEIPIIQRDYAHGRQSAVEVRNGFLDALYGYLQENVPFRDLDFIYGDIDAENNFIPLDGQQRLTTLFLLHWYFALKEGKMEDLKQELAKNGYSRFTYKTRQSAADFCDALFKNTISLGALLPADRGLKNALSKTIKDCSWYFLSWNYDPTIQSMLCMLDAIHYKFKETGGFYDRLINMERPIITFQFLPLKDYGLTDDLYIKMNSRGKPLTKFENFKAKFEQHLDNFNGKLPYSPNVRDYFANKIDTQWADLFWTFRDKKENVFDKQMMHFISAVAINSYSLRYVDPKKYIDRQDNLPLNFYLSQNKHFIATLTDALDLISIDHKYNQYLSGFHYYNEIESFDNIINNNFSDAGYVERIKFFAYYSYIVKWKTADGLADWMRVIVNLTDNTAPYNNELEFINSLRVILKILPHSRQVIEYLTSGENISGFNPAQIKEEQIKAHLILKKEDWTKKIYEAEKHQYFKGQITFALAFAGIKNYYDAHKNCDWDVTSDNLYLQAFDRYLNFVFSLFDGNGLKTEAKNNYLLHRAILAKGDYLLYAKSNFSFLIDRERDVSWKRLLLGDDHRKGKREFFRQVIDDPAFNPSDLNCLNTICLNADNSLPDWRRKFIAYPQMFDYLGTYKYIRFENDDEIYLLTGIKMNGEHSELFTYALYLHLKTELLPAPFKGVYYHYVNTDKEQPCLFFHGFHYRENQPELDIYYEGKGMYKFRLFDRNKKTPEKELFDLLTNNDFIAQPACFEIILPESEVKSKIEVLCKAFATLGVEEITSI